MQGALFVDSGSTAQEGRAVRRVALDLPASVRAAMVACGFVPILHAVLSALPIVLAARGDAPWSIVWLTPVIVFALPPLLVRAATFGRPLAGGIVSPASREFLRWWFTAQCQVLFARLPMLEELLRLVPGLYSMWLRLWGARIGSLVYWSPGVVILDRPLIDVGNRVVFGVGAKVAPHALAPEASGTISLHLGPIIVEDDVLVGAYSMLLPGCEIARGEATPPWRSVHSFCRFTGGRRVRLSERRDRNGSTL